MSNSHHAYCLVTHRFEPAPSVVFSTNELKDELVVESCGAGRRAFGKLRPESLANSNGKAKVTELPASPCKVKGDDGIGSAAGKS